MKRGFLALVLVLGVSSVYANEEESFGMHCGSRGNLWGTILSDHVIPDFFPPENPLLRALFVNSSSFLNLTMCEESFSRVHLGESCMMHDQCYATLGETKDGCDADLKQGWLESCEENYRGVSGFLCRSACNVAVNIMYNAMRFRNGSFCPSCEAFSNAQKKARS